MGDVSDRIGRPTDNGQVCSLMSSILLLFLEQQVKALNMGAYIMLTIDYNLLYFTSKASFGV